MHIADTRQIRLADERMIQGCGFPGYILMETAGRRAAEEIISRYPKLQSALVLAGPGNNGGDGFVIARYLHLAGWHVKVLMSQDRAGYTGDAAIALNALNGSGIAMETWKGGMALGGQDLIIDALLGTGIQSALRGPVAEMIAAFRNSKAEVVAIDLPSGLDASSGTLLNEVIPAACTITFQLPKVCHLVHPAAGKCGDIRVLDIGIWPEIINGLGIQRQSITREFVRTQFSDRMVDGHKGSYGHVLLVGGSARYAGAIALSAHASLRAGAGLSTAFCPEIAREAIHALGPEVMLDPQAGDALSESAIAAIPKALQGKSVVAVGPGLGNQHGQAQFLEALLRACTVPMVLDADALNILAAHPELWALVRRDTVITPHPGEMRRLQASPDPVTHRLEAAETLAQARGVVVVLKGPGSIIACPDGQTYINTNGNPGMGTGGTGDVLTGLIAGLLPRFSPGTASAIGVFLHGLAGDLAANELGEESLVAGDVLRFVAPAFHSTLQPDLQP